MDIAQVIFLSKFGKKDRNLNYRQISIGASFRSRQNCLMLSFENVNKRL